MNGGGGRRGENAREREMHHKATVLHLRERRRGGKKSRGDAREENNKVC